MTDYQIFSNPLKPRSCVDPVWSPTPRQVADEIRVWSRYGTFGDLVWLPLKSTLRRAFWINFDIPIEESHDPKGGRPYITKLVHLMCEHVPLPPAIGYHDKDGVLVIHDGNHRLAAAKRAKLADFPILIYVPVHW